MKTFILFPSWWVIIKIFIRISASDVYMEKYEGILEGIGLTRGECKVYLSLLRLGETTTGKLIEEAGLSGSKIYVILDKLIKKGLVGYIIKGKTRYFYGCSARKLLEYADRCQSEILEKKRQIEEIVPSLEKLRRIEPGHSSAVIHQGYEGIRSAIYEALACEAGEWLAFGVGMELGKPFTRMWNHFNRELAARNIPIRIILSDRTAAKGLEMVKTMEARLIENQATTPVSISGDVLIIYNWHETSVVKIDNAETAESFRQFFYGVWKTSKKI